MSALLSDDEMDLDKDLLMKDKANCTSSELESIRRERNRMHAKKTRMRKKRMIQEMEAVRVLCCRCQPAAAFFDGLFIVLTSCV